MEAFPIFPYLEKRDAPLSSSLRVRPMGKVRVHHTTLPGTRSSADGRGCGINRSITTLRSLYQGARFPLYIYFSWTVYYVRVDISLNIPNTQGRLQIRAQETRHRQLLPHSSSTRLGYVSRVGFSLFSRSSIFIHVYFSCSRLTK